uniref:Uncharacterized protein n=1 Tax=Oryza sativa subsp. japonica TaxID=39947 RepID=Q67UD0_ORYSJ|nr:hypothetical protein [Oryza sativa Japonica Group]BAD38241.1 hypothetical protein [Oryza sativa Japonica Group]
MPAAHGCFIPNRMAELDLSTSRLVVRRTGTVLSGHECTTRRCPSMPVGTRPPPPAPPPPPPPPPHRRLLGHLGLLSSQLRVVERRLQVRRHAVDDIAVGAAASLCFRCSRRRRAPATVAQPRPPLSCLACWLRPLCTRRFASPRRREEEKEGG